ncbi:Asp-tRNA(Asn)/Glu-tRNA(Gln) amidotransferase GatCAB subunit C, partial [bacterium]|nr:Asp-tRNA(Asn)/Glu-tRNA(Gln) amidotransferase GatCAB subunit C [bacterium]
MILPGGLPGVAAPATKRFLVVIDPGQSAAYAAAQTVRSEYVISVVGTVRKRSEETVNPRLATGDLEIVVSELSVLNTAETPPFPISEKESDENAGKVDEDIRLRYRYLDIRRPSVQHNLIMRHKIAQVIRHCLSDAEFIEVETPVLTKSTPEGARDYLVPSRIHPEKFYALPQSPQLFKQLLMVGGLERYFQITKCFRDEDLRPNRQPEFTQVDLEASFIDESFIMELIEELIQRVFAVADIKIQTPFPRITYAEAMSRYGNDHPDLR